MFRNLSFILLAITACLWASGCTQSASHEAELDHEHEAELAGEPAAHAHAPAHSDSAPGPHGGHLVELGDCEYHAELVHDDSGKVTVYLWDAAVKQPVSTDASDVTIQLFEDGRFADYTLTAAPADAKGGAVPFESADPALAKALEEADVRGRLTVAIGGEKLSGDIEHVAHEHGDEEHEHGEE